MHIFTSPTKGDGTLCFSRRRYVGRYICLWTTSWRQFKSDCHQTWSVIPSLATGDEVIKFWKVKDQDQWGRYALYRALLVEYVLQRYFHRQQMTNVAWILLHCSHNDTLQTTVTHYHDCASRSATADVCLHDTSTALHNIDYSAVHALNSWSIKLAKATRSRKRLVLPALQG